MITIAADPPPSQNQHAINYYVVCKPLQCSLQTSLSEGFDGDLVALLTGRPLGGVVREGLLGHGLGLGGLLEARPDGAGCPGDELRNK